MIPSGQLSQLAGRCNKSKHFGARADELPPLRVTHFDKDNLYGNLAGFPFPVNVCVRVGKITCNLLFSAV